MEGMTLNVHLSLKNLLQVGSFPDNKFISFKTINIYFKVLICHLITRIEMKCEHRVLWSYCCSILSVINLFHFISKYCSLEISSFLWPENYAFAEKGKGKVYENHAFDNYDLLSEEAIWILGIFQTFFRSLNRKCLTWKWQLVRQLSSWMWEMEVMDAIQLSNKNIGEDGKF